MHTVTHKHHHTPSHAHAHTNTHPQKCLHMHKYTHTCTHAFACTHSHTLACAHTLSHAHTHTFTHMHSWLLNPCGNEFPISGHIVENSPTSSLNWQKANPSLESRLKKCVVHLLDFWTFLSQRGEMFPCPRKLLFSGEMPIFTQRQWLIFFRWEFMF